jgi:hypothetical protein
MLVVSHDSSRPDGDKIFFNDQLTTLENLPAVLRKAREAFPGDSLIAKIDRGVPTETLVSILQIARELDLKVTLATSMAPSARKTATENPAAEPHAIAPAAE